MHALLVLALALLLGCPRSRALAHAAGRRRIGVVGALRLFAPGWLVF